jgi:adenine-specific DNA-methyltransferase
METRLKLARHLLSDIGVIFISIDEYEFANLKLLCDQVFGANHFVENFIWVKNATKNNSTTTGTIHEYILCYAKNAKNLKGLIRAPRQGVLEVSEYAAQLVKEGLSFSDINKKIVQFYKSNPAYEGISVFNKVDHRGVYRTVDISAPSKGPRDTFDIIHPITKLPCKKSSRVWAFKKDTIDEMLKNDEIEFGEDHTTIPRVKRYLKNLDTMVLSSVLHISADGKRDLDKLSIGSSFTYPKPVLLLKTIFQAFPYHTTIMDFFGGSGTTMQAVLELNNESSITRKCILITNNENNIFEEITQPRIAIVAKDNATIEVSKVAYASIAELEEYEADPELILTVLSHSLKLKHNLEMATAHKENEEAIIFNNEIQALVIAKTRLRDKAIIDKINSLKDSSNKLIHVYLLDEEDDYCAVHEAFWHDSCVILHKLPKAAIKLFNNVKKDLAS